MVALAIVMVVGTVLIAVWVLRYANAILFRPVDEGDEGGGGGGSDGIDPLDQPGDGLSPYDLYLGQLPAPPVDDRLLCAVAAGE
jgi:hypothetical protein